MSLVMNHEEKADDDECPKSIENYEYDENAEYEEEDTITTNPMATTTTMTSKKEAKEMEADKMIQNLESKKQEKNKNNSNNVDWGKKTDFKGVDKIGYLCDDGEVILGDINKIHLSEPKIFVHWNTDAGHFGKTFAWLSVPDDRICAPPKDTPKQRTMGFGTGTEMTTYGMSGGSHTYNMYDYVSRDKRSDMRGSGGTGRYFKYPSGNNDISNNNNNTNKTKEEAFVSQEKVSYKKALEILLDGDCCFGLYDKTIKQWRAAVYMQHWDKKNRIMVRFTQDVSNLYFYAIKNFPVDYIMDDPERFSASEKDLRDKSNVPKDKIDAWNQRRKEKAIKLINGYLREIHNKYYFTIPHELNQIFIDYYFQ